VLISGRSKLNICCCFVKPSAEGSLQAAHCRTSNAQLKDLAKNLELRYHWYFFFTGEAATPAEKTEDKEDTQR